MRTEDPFTPLLDLDPDLGRLLPAERIGEARVELGVRITFVARGAWQADRLSDVGSEHLGLLMLDGVIAREVLLADTTSIELVGAGDVLRPWHADDGPSLSRHEIRWTALADAHLAVLDRRFASRLTRFPEVNTTIMERILDRVHRFALTQAISQLNGVDRRLLALFWHLAERWGRMTPSGIVVPLALSHRELGQLVGARRPTISSALGALAQRGELTRRSDGSWLLTGEPIGIPSDEARRIIEHRRRLLPPLAAPDPDVAARERALEERERALEERERWLESRERDGEMREFWAEERDRVADELDRLADEHYGAGAGAQPEPDANA
jgi:CRP-like cAMP-binding protein